jgi:hypothetical protein
MKQILKPFLITQTQNNSKQLVRLHDYLSAPLSAIQVHVSVHLSAFVYMHNYSTGCLVCLSSYLSICLSAELSVCSTIFLSVHSSVNPTVCTSICQPNSQPNQLSVCPTVYLIVNLSPPCLFVCLPVYLYLHVFVWCLSVRLTVCLSTCLCPILFSHFILCLSGNLSIYPSVSHSGNVRI